MLHHLDRVRFASFVFSALFRNTFVCSTAAAWQTGRPAASQGNLLVAGIASYLLPLLPARMHHLPPPPPPVPQMPSYWQWLNVARLRVASHLLCSLRGCVYLLFISCCLLLSSPTWHGGAGQCRYHIWFRAARLERSPSLLCFAARQLRR